MKFNTYFDLSLLADEEISAWDGLGRVLRLIHQSSAATGLPFAVDFPDWSSERDKGERGCVLGNRLRVFTTSEDAATALYATKRADLQSWCRSNKQGLVVLTAPATDHYTAYIMHRIPSGISRPNAPDAERWRGLQAQARERRIAQQRSLPFLTMRSSKGHKFRLVIERIEASADAGGRPNGYGLSRSTQIVALPQW